MQETHKTALNQMTSSHVSLSSLKAIFKKQAWFLALTLWCWICQPVMNPWTSPSASWPRLHLPSLRCPSCEVEPEVGS